MTRKRILNALLIFFIFLVLAFFSVWLLLAKGIIQMDWYSKVQEKSNYERMKHANKRILILGDSQLENWPVEHTLSKDIEAFCEENELGYLNAAHAGFGPIEHLDRFKVIASDYKPDLIIIFFYAGNDISDVMYRENWNPKQPTHDVAHLDETGTKNKREQLTERNEKLPPEVAKMMLSESEFDWKALEEAGIDKQLIKYAQNRVLNPNAIGKEYVNPHLLVMGSWKENYLFDNCMVNDPASKYAWIKIAKVYEELLLKADELGSEVCFVSIPATVQLDNSHFELYEGATFSVGEELSYSNGSQELLERFCIVNRVQHVNLLPPFIRHPKSASLYFENDDHLSSEGHLTAFKEVQSEILDRFVIGERYVDQRKTRTGYYKTFKNWALDYYKSLMDADPAWRESVTQKAKEKGISYQEMKELDSQYLLEQDSLINH